MKKLFILTLFGGLTLSGCNKGEGVPCDAVTTEAPSSEVDQLRQYLSVNGIVAIEDSRGFFYVVFNTGTGDHPTVCSNVTVNYTGRLTNGVLFDQGANASFNLSGLITGWKEGLPVIATGGRITSILPPSLGYGSTASGAIPANSITIFTIDLLAIN